MTDSTITFNKKGKLANEYYMKELERLQVELVKLQYWIRETQSKVVIIFEGRDAAGKGGIIKRITEKLKSQDLPYRCPGHPN